MIKKSRCRTGKIPTLWSDTCSWPGPAGSPRIPPPSSPSPMANRLIPNCSPSAMRPGCFSTPFSRGIGKSFSANEVIDLINHLSPLPVVVVGVGDFLEHRHLPYNGIDLMNKTSLRQLIWLVRQAGWTLSVDSGPMHLAAAITDRLLSVHTWTNPKMVGPLESECLCLAGFEHFEGHRNQASRFQRGPVPEERIRGAARPAQCGRPRGDRKVCESSGLKLIARRT